VSQGSGDGDKVDMCLAQNDALEGRSFSTHC